MLIILRGSLRLLIIFLYIMYKMAFASRTPHGRMYGLGGRASPWNNREGIGKSDRPSTEEEAVNYVEAIEGQYAPYVQEQADNLLDYLGMTPRGGSRRRKFRRRVNKSRRRVNKSRRRVKKSKTRRRRVIRRTKKYRR